MFDYYGFTGEPLLFKYLNYADFRDKYPEYVSNRSMVLLERTGSREGLTGTLSNDRTFVGVDFLKPPTREVVGRCDDALNRRRCFHPSSDWSSLRDRYW